MSRRRSAARPEAKGAAHHGIGLAWGTGLALMLSHALIFGRLFPNASGMLGHDHQYFLPKLLFGRLWWMKNGWAAVPWFSPVACGGLPAFPNPQDLFFSVPQLLSFCVDPLRAVHLTLLGFAAIGLVGSYGLLRRSFGLSSPASMLGATIFLFNGFFAYRMAIGHITAHGFMLLPAIALFWTRPREGGRWSEGRNVVSAGLLLAYLLLTSAQFLLPFLAALGAVGLLHLAVHGERRRFVLRLAGSLAVGCSLGAAKLVASLTLLSHFPRADYPLPGLTSLLTVARVALSALFIGPPDELARKSLVNIRWELGRHEFEYGVTVVPLLVLLTCIAGWLVRHRKRGGSSFIRIRLIETILLAGVLALPLVLNLYTPRWNAFLEALPILASTSTYVRWFCIYIPVTSLLVALLFDANVPGVRLKWSIQGAAALAIVAINASADLAYYEAQTYDPREIVDAHAALQSSGQVPLITQLVPGGAHAFLRGASTLACYEPLFGYRLEAFPRGELRPGPALSEAPILNVKNPACYVFPEENACAPGAHFRQAQRREAAAFLGYRPFDFRRSSAQKAAEVLSLSSLIAAVGFLGAASWAGLRRRLRTR